MIIRKAFKFQLKTGSFQEEKLLRFAGSCRKVWNLALELQKKRLDEKKYCLSYSKLAAELIIWKKDPKFKYLNAVHSQPLQQTLMNLDRALRDAFDKKNPKRFPQFKKKGKHDSFRYPQGFKIDEEKKQVYLPKIGWIAYRKSRSIEGVPKNITVSYRYGKWSISIQTEQEIVSNTHPASSMVGIDMGIVNFASLSTGEKIASVNSLRAHQEELAKKQRLLSRKQKFSKNWNKQRLKILRLYKNIFHIRYDFLHKTSTKISNNHAIIVLEDLKVANMSKSASGTKDRPGKNVRAKQGLNKSILDQGWSEFRRQLEYKQSWRGGNVMTISPKNTSRRCYACGYTSEENRKVQDQFSCISCGHHDHADLNAAKNILAAGHAVLACGDQALSGLSEKQEPIRIATKVA